MKKSKLMLAIGGLLMAAALAAPAAAQDQGIFLGGSIGQAKWKHACTPYVGTCDDADTAYRMFGGYQFNRNAALEFGYANLADTFIDGVSADGGVPARFDGTAKAADLSAVFSWPFSDRFAVLGRLGVYRSQFEVRGDFGGPFNLSEHNTGWTWGAGVALGFGRNLSLRAEWQRYNAVGGGSTGEVDIDYTNIGAVWRF